MRISIRLKNHDDDIPNSADAVTYKTVVIDANDGAQIEELLHQMIVDFWNEMAQDPSGIAIGPCEYLALCGWMVKKNQVKELIFCLRRASSLIRKISSWST